MNVEGKKFQIAKTACPSYIISGHITSFVELLMYFCSIYNLVILKAFHLQFLRSIMDHPNNLPKITGLKSDFENSTSYTIILIYSSLFSFHSFLTMIDHYLLFISNAIL